MMKLASHIHSDWSDDCDWSLPRLAKMLSRCGFDGALICDHDRSMTEERRQSLVAECAAVSRNGFLLIPGVEYQDPDHVIHIPVFGDVPFFGRSPVVRELLEWVHERPAVALMAHPARRDAHRRFDPTWASMLDGIEVWSRKYDGVNPNEWALQVAANHGIAPWVSLDFHGPRQLFPLAMRLDIASTSSMDAVLTALRAGRVRPTAFGVDMASPRWSRHASLLRGVESIRRRTAPLVRRAEASLRGVTSHISSHGRPPERRGGAGDGGSP